jgi:hypothetical protein
MNKVAVSKASIWDTGKLNIFLFYSKRIRKIFCLKTQEMTEMAGENCKKRKFIIFALTKYY